MKRRFLAKTPARRTITALAGGTALAALTSGCAVFSTVQTNVPYVPADGVPANIGELSIRNLALVGDGSGEAVLTGSAINLGTDSLTVKVTPQAAADASSTPTSSQLTLSPRQQLDMTTKGLQVSNLPAKPGTMVPVTITSTPGGSTVVKVPVLSPVGYYATVTPTPVATATPGLMPTPTSSTTSGTTATATPTATATSS